MDVLQPRILDLKRLSFKMEGEASGQDGGVGRHTVPPRTTKEGQQQFKNKK